jgi:hypothetical protein
MVRGSRHHVLDCGITARFARLQLLARKHHVNRDANQWRRESRAEQFAVCVRMAVSLGFSKDCFAMARGVRDPLGRACAYGLTGAVTVVLALGCVGVRQLETRMSATIPLSGGSQLENGSDNRQRGFDAFAAWRKYQVVAMDFNNLVLRLRTASRAAIG